MVSQQPTPAPLLLTLRDVQARLQFGRDRVYRMTKDGSIPAIRVGRKFYVPAASLNQWIEQQLAS